MYQWMHSSQYRLMLRDKKIQKERLLCLKFTTCVEQDSSNRNLPSEDMGNTVVDFYDNVTISHIYIRSTLSYEVKQAIEVHELSHASDAAGSLIPQRDSFLLISKAVSFDDQEDFALKDTCVRYIMVTKVWYNYITDITEIRARLNVIRKLCFDNNIYNPFTEKITLKELEFLKTVIDGTGDMNDLFSIYTDEDLVIILNTVS